MVQYRNNLCWKFKNHVVDCLSHYYERQEGDSTSDEEINWANVDMHLDPDRNEAVTIEGKPSPQKSKCLAERWETHILEAQEMASAAEKTT